jgi:hypothetical protein
LKRKNLLILHLESIAWQTFHAFPDAFPNLKKAIPASRLYRSYFASATSTQMVLAYLFHGNDFELDAATGLAKPAANNPSLFSTLRDAGYRTDFLCVTALHANTKLLPLFAETLPPIWSTNDFRELIEKFETLTSAPPFAVYFWNLVTHIEHAQAFASHAESMDDLVGGACAVADHAMGALLDILERKNLMDETTIVIFGDHGDDFFTHGFKKGLLHGVEPYTHILHAPLLIRDRSLPAGIDDRLAGTVDLAPTCLDLLGFSPDLAFADSGRSLLREGERICVFSQNFTGNQPDNWDSDIRKCFAASDRSHTLLATSRGLEFFNHRLDPANQWNLLHFFEMDGDGELVLSPPAGHTYPHFATALHYMLREDHLKRDFGKLRTALKEHIGKKNAYISERAPAPVHTLDLSCLDRINRHGRDRFFDITPATGTEDKRRKKSRARRVFRRIRDAVFRRGRK